MQVLEMKGAVPLKHGQHDAGTVNAQSSCIVHSSLGLGGRQDLSAIALPNCLKIQLTTLGFY